jgi:O-antigen/teichoic acid export membrane protein
MVLSVVFIPVYLRFLGIEGYGLIGFFAALQGVFGILDLGIGLTLNRELARLSAVEGAAREQRDLVRTLETVYWGIALAAAAAVVALAPVIAQHWITPKHLSVAEVGETVRLMGVVIALQFPFSFYQGGLTGLQRQVPLNVILAAVGTLRGAGAVLVLWLVAPTVRAYFVWQIVAAAVGTLACLLFLWRSLPSAQGTASFRKELLAGVWRFAAAVSGNAVIGVVLTQLDKVILIRMLTLEMFGYYALAGTVASALWSIIVPVNTALFPRFAQLFELKDEAALAELYHRASQIVAVALLPISVTIAFYSREILLIWTRNPVTAENAWLLVTLLVIGTTLNGLASVPGYLQFATGWPQLTMYTNLVMSVILVPSIVFMCSRYGATGAAVVWVVMNSGYLLFTVPIMHRRLLVAEKWRWYLDDIGSPLAGILIFSITMRGLLTVKFTTLPARLGFLAGIWFLGLIISGMLASHVRVWVIGHLRKYWEPMNA